MGFLAVKNTAIRAIYTSVPKQKVFTKDYEWVTIAERDLFAKTTGIIERRVASSTTTCSDLCFQAADELLNDLNCRDQIDLILFVSQSPDYFLPSTAVILQDKLGLSKNTVAFDINLGCSGYVYGLTVIGQFLQNGNFRKALLLCGDKSTISTNYQDKSTFPLFGDAGSATLLEFDKSADEWFAHLASDGSGKDSIIIEHGHSRHPYGSVSDEYIEYEPGVIRTKKHLALNGMDVFNFALKEVAPSIKQMLENFEINIDDIDYFVLHQANKLINESVRKKLKVTPEKVPYSIQNFGNTSSASIPLTICTCLKEKIESDQLTLLLAGFGVGFSWGSVVLKTSEIRTKIVEHD
ncbi:MAG: ketoacyl-ACP synthase III [Crocinitomicaceae bacterium]|nr:ketoacyl-ACP synthase III [Crocinitomicaceae bacterium]MCF8410992.1 ketoacyl-ACP synthase III [Crocinitomicaceae bacterium]MCF8443881.1 ketoacyl-ACP synthase III [Crocinitomicaceae bacterium]